MDDEQTLKSRISTLLVVYGALFGASLITLVINWSTGHTTLGTVAWIVLLGGAVATRLYRTTLVNRYNAMLLGKDAPLT